FEDLDVTAGSARRSLLFEVQDAGGGGGTWSLGLQTQAATSGAFVDLPATVAVPPGGTAEIPVVVRANATAATGDNGGFLTPAQRSLVSRRVRSGSPGCSALATRTTCRDTPAPRSTRTC